MDSKKKKANSIAEEDKEIEVNNDSFDNAKVIQWEDYEQELASLCSLTTALNGAEQEKLLLQEKLQSLMQEANWSLAGERVFLHLKSSQRLLRVRQQFMVSQVSFLYPVKVVIGQAREQELESFTTSIKSGVPAGLKPPDQGSLTIAGLHLTMIPFTKMSVFTDKEEVQRSATALGYVAHAVSLIASYMKVPLRYPLRLGCSRSYIHDYAPSIEPASSDLVSNSLTSMTGNPVEFPLSLEGQDSTTAAYGVFLLNKFSLIPYMVQLHS